MKTSITPVTLLAFSFFCAMAFQCPAQQSFQELISSASERPSPETLSPAEAQRLNYCVSGDAAEYGTPEAFIAKIAAAGLDAGELKNQKTLRYQSTRGIPFELQFNDKDWLPKAKIKGATLDFDNWPVCESPYVTSRNGVLNVNDGRKGFIIDWSGNAPNYSHYNVKK